MLNVLLILLAFAALTAVTYLVAVFSVECRRPWVVCLMYHRFATREEYRKRQGTERIFTIPVESFDQQIRHLKDSGYTFVTPEQVRRCAVGEAQLPHPSVLLTIDDGCMSIYQHAIPVLRKYGARATVFVTTDPASYVFQEACGGERRLTDNELRQADGDCLQFESHAVTHRPLRGMSEELIRHELAESKRQLDAVLLRPVSYLAIPGNWFDDNVMRIAREVGYKAVWCSKPGGVRAGSDLFGLPRVNVEGQLTIGQFASAITPWGVTVRRLLASIKTLPAQLLGPRVWLPIRRAILRFVPGNYLSVRRLLTAAGVLAMIAAAVGALSLLSR